MLNEEEMLELQLLMEQERSEEEEDDEEWIENENLPEWPEEAVEWQEEPRTLDSSDERASRILSGYTNTMEAINRLSDRLQNLRLERWEATRRGLAPIAIPYQEGWDEWAKEMRACERALEILWDRRRSEIGWEDDFARTTTPKGYRRTPESAASVHRDVPATGSHGRLLLPLSRLPMF
jgi:hypothetical protein